MRTSAASRTTALSLLLCGASATLGQAPPAATTPPTSSPAGVRQSETDEYTRYELLAPGTASFKIRYEVTATTPGATVYYNPIRKGSTASDEAVYDAMTGEPLKFEVISGDETRKDPLMADEDTSSDFIRVHLARPVPQDGQARMLIIKTYQDAKSYFRERDAIVFQRSLSIRRNRIVLPAGYELIECNVPSQVLPESDGRIGISFLNAGPGEAPLKLKAKPGAQTGPSAAPHPPTAKKSWEAPFQGESERARLSERAHQDRDIVYFLQQPETHSFSLYHDYTESRPGMNRYLNVVREGSTVWNPSAYVLDTGEKLATRVLTGADMAAEKIAADDEPVSPATQVVLITFPPVKTGQSLRLRISETYTAPASYGLDGDELVFDRSLGRPRNAVVLPDGWYLLASAIPASVRQLPDGRIRLDFWNGRPDSVDVLIKAKRRATTTGSQSQSGEHAFDYDRQAPLDLQETGVTKRGDIAIHDISYASPKGGRVPAYLVIPPGKGPFAAVIWGHWYWENSPARNRTEFLVEAVALANSGVVSLLTDGPVARPGHVESKEPLNEQQVTDLIQQIVDMERGADLLLARKDVDARRLAYVGHSYNATVGGFLSGLDKRFKAFVLMAGGLSDEADMKSKEFQDFRQKIGPEKLDAFQAKYSWLDPGKFVSHAAPAAVFLQYATKEDFLTPERAKAYAANVSEPKKLKIYDAPHALNAEALRDRLAFLAEQLNLKPLDAAVVAAIPALYQPPNQGQ